MNDRLEGELDFNSTIQGFFDERQYFLDFLANAKTSKQLKDQFHKLFGKDQPYSVDITEKTILGIIKAYEQSVNELNKAIEINRNNDRKKNALTNQLYDLQHEELLNFLPENQFLPNANMPTGIMIFRAADTLDEKTLFKLQEEIRQLLRQKRSGNLSLDNEIKKKEKKRKSLNQPLILSREGRIALNEFAPCQSFVVDEKTIALQGYFCLAI